MNNSQIFPIVFATDKESVPILEVAIHSLACNARTPNVIYKIYVLSLGLSTEIAPKLARHILINRQVEIDFIDIEDLEQSGFINSSEQPFKVANLKLLIPQIFNQYDYILYLNNDMAIAVDVFELTQFNTAIKDQLVAGVRDLKEVLNIAHNTYRPQDFDQTIASGKLVNETSYFGKDYVEKVLGLPSYQLYLNTDMLYFNLAKIRELNLEDAFVESYQALSSQYKLFAGEQDAINYVLARNNGIFYLDRKFNDHYTNYELASIFEPDLDKAQALIDQAACIQTFKLSLEEWDQKITLEKFASIHNFRDNPKPWQTFNFIYVMFWWAAVSTMENYADYVVSFHNKYGVIIDQQSLTYINHLGKRFYSTECLTPYTSANVKA